MWWWYFLTKAICDDDVSHGSLLVFLSREKIMGCGNLRPSVESVILVRLPPSRYGAREGPHPQFQSSCSLWMCCLIFDHSHHLWIINRDGLLGAPLLLMSDCQSLNRLHPPFTEPDRDLHKHIFMTFMNVCISLRIICCNVKLLPNGCVNPLSLCWWWMIADNWSDSLPVTEPEQEYILSVCFLSMCCKFSLIHIFHKRLDNLPFLSDHTSTLLRGQRKWI